MIDTECFSIEKNLYWPVFKRQELCIEHGEGVYLYDIERKRYIDFVSGIGVAILGHSNPEINSVIARQAGELLSCSNIFYSLPQLKLAEKLSKYSEEGKWFFSNSGAEAVESAIKLARRYGSNKGKYEIITLKNSFHGRTMATTAATGQKAFKKNIGPMPEGFKHIEPNNIKELENAFTDKTCALMIELIQGESGVYILERKFVREARRLCDKNGALLIADEVQTGIGRTGRFFAYRHFGAVPDIVTIAKGLGNGLPISATWAKDELSSVFESGDHGTTYGGNAFVCEVAAKVIEIIGRDKLISRNEEMGDYFLKRIKEYISHMEAVKEIRSLGLMLAVEFEEPIGQQIVEKLRDKGLLVAKSNNNIIRFLPPYVIEKEHLDIACNALYESLKELGQ